MSKLVDYIGHYDTGENAFLSVRLDGNKLFGQITNLPEFPLFISGPDAYRIVPKNPEFEIGITFERDDTGRVTGIEVIQKKHDKRSRGPKLHGDRRPLEGDLAPLDGYWLATLGLLGTPRFHIGLELFADGEGALDGFLTLPEQRAGYLPITEISLDGDQLTLASAPTAATFAGKLKRKGDTVSSIRGKWSHRGKTMKAEFKRPRD